MGDIEIQLYILLNKASSSSNRYELAIAFDSVIVYKIFMLNMDGFKTLAKNRLETAQLLINSGEYAMAAYMMGFVLECVLKAASCKSLRLSEYPYQPKQTKNDRITNFFRVHSFDTLLVVSGVSDLFGLTGKGSANWSGFTQEYVGDWTSIRYDALEQQFDEKKVTGLFSYLKGIILLIEGEKRW